jgi:hypothetical protein
VAKAAPVESCLQAAGDRSPARSGYQTPIPRREIISDLIARIATSSTPKVGLVANSGIRYSSRHLFRLPASPSAAGGTSTTARPEKVNADSWADRCSFTDRTKFTASCPMTEDDKPWWTSGAMDVVETNDRSTTERVPNTESEESQTWKTWFGAW